MMMKKVTVMGGGNAGKTLAADAALAGHEVCLFEMPKYGKSIESIKKSKKIKISGNQKNAKNFFRDGVATLDMVTCDVVEAVKNTDIIVISVRATGYEEVFEMLVPVIEDGQVISIYPDNFGSLIFRKKMREMGCKKDVIVGGWSSLPYGCRLVCNNEIDEVFILYRAVSLRGDTIPSKDRDVFFSTMKEFAPMDTVDMVPGDTVIDIGFCNVNPILHVPATLLNIGAIDNWGKIEYVGDKDVYFSIYRHGFSENVSKIQYAIYLEEVELARKIGIEMQHYPKEIFFSRLGILGPEFMGDGYITPLNQNMPDFYKMKYFHGERFTSQSRYITEDIPVGCHLFYEFAKKYSVDVPIIESMINIGNVISETNYFTKGMTLETLGISGIDKKELLDYLREGVILK